MMENDTNIFKSREDELIKLYIIICNAREGERFTAKYLKEKTGNSLSGYPLILYPSLYAEYKKFKGERT